ncbi:MAG TPA: hypothetical protein VJ111_09980 [Chitinophagaceae bacterium]|nr:hypothetical protein [Chitinophagaceae bacterium]
MKEKSAQSLPKDYQLLYDKTEPMNICILPAIYKCRILQGYNVYNSTSAYTICRFIIQYLRPFVSSPDTYRDDNYDQLHPFQNVIIAPGDFLTGHV